MVDICWFNVGSASVMLAKRWTSIGVMPGISWEVDNVLLITISLIGLSLDAEAYVYDSQLHNRVT